RPAWPSPRCCSRRTPFGSAPTPTAWPVVRRAPARSSTSAAAIRHGEDSCDAGPTGAIELGPLGRRRRAGYRELPGRRFGAPGGGVLLDIARHRGVPALGPGEVIAPAELEACAAAQGVAIAPGDVLLLRTGWLSGWLADAALYERGQPGVGLASLPWLHERRI